MRTCLSCKKEKPLDEFYKERSRKDGLDIYCKICKRRKVKDNKEKSSKRYLAYLNPICQGLILSMVDGDLPEDLEGRLIGGWRDFFWNKKIKSEYQLQELNNIMDERMMTSERICLLSPGQESIL